VSVFNISVPHSQTHTIYTLASTWPGLAYACSAQGMVQIHIPSSSLCPYQILNETDSGPER